MLRSLDVTEHVANPAIKQTYVTTMFDVIAPGYDSFSRNFSFGMDKGWKQGLIQRLDALLEESPAVLDLACGTGDLCKSVQSLRPAARVWGVDVSGQMLKSARGELNGSRIGLCQADGMLLPAAGNSIDLVTIGYGLRNFPDCESAVQEIYRVLNSGGVFACLDFYRPSNPVWRELYLGYLQLAGTVYGLAVHSHGAVFGYIAKSVRAHATVSEFNDCLAGAGFDLEDVDSKLLGGICLHIARKT